MRETELWANGGLCSEAPRAANLQVGRSYRPIQTCNEARPRRGCPRLARFRRATNFAADSELSERSWSVHELFLAHTVTCCVRPSQLDRSRKQRVAQPSMHAHAIMRVQCTACNARPARHGAQGTARKALRANGYHLPQAPLFSLPELFLGLVAQHAAPQLDDSTSGRRVRSHDDLEPCAIRSEAQRRPLPFPPDLLSEFHP